MKTEQELQGSIFHLWLHSNYFLNWLGNTGKETWKSVEESAAKPFKKEGYCHPTLREQELIHTAVYNS